MANKTSNEKTTKILIASFAGAILVALIVAVTVSLLNNSDSGNTEEDEVATGSPFQPVKVEGNPLPQLADKAQDSAVGTVAPTVTGQTFFGEPVSIAADGKPKVLMFMAHWCPHCQKELPLVTDWIKDNGSKYNMSYHAIATATRPGQSNFPPGAWFKKENYTLPVMADDRQVSAANAYGLSSYPFFVFLDGQNKVVSRGSGEMSMTEFETRVKVAVGATEAATSSTTTTISAP